MQERDGAITVRTTMRADHFLGGERYSLGGQYVHHLRRQPSTWTIFGVTLVVAWQEGDRAMLAAAATRAQRA